MKALAAWITVAACDQTDLNASIDRFDYSSRVVDDHFAVDVYRPISTAPNTGFRVAYVLDGPWHAEHVARAFEQQRLDVVVVGVGYLVDDSAAQRRRDYTPVRSAEEPATWEAPPFLEFVTDELIPFVEERYPVRRRDRALFGHERGGLFVAWTMLEQGRKPWFTDFVVASPDFAWSQGAVLDREAERAADGAPMEARLWLGRGEYDPITVIAYADAFASQLRARGYERLQVEQVVHDGGFGGESWTTVYEHAVSRIEGDS